MATASKCRCDTTTDIRIETHMVDVETGSSQWCGSREERRPRLTGQGMNGIHHGLHHSGLRVRRKPFETDDQDCGGVQHQWPLLNPPV